ncbi:MAG: FKBP-type peptidyl-prolyl cis-trans isomerase [Coriobacteriia bacterium]|nr:FKBP-type peptidyl-prolyl cis-trans isomerase [Coriobacteriia bacterium]
MVQCKRVFIYMLSFTLMLALAFFVSACTSDEPDASDADLEEVIELLAEDEVLEIDEFAYVDIEVGEGPEVKEGDTVLIHWTGMYLDGMVFNSSTMQGGPYEFVVGDSDVIEAWQVGVVGMQVGGVRLLDVPSDMAFGEDGIHGLVAPHQDLRFEITLEQIL